jgi:NAD(P)H-flavin reductase
MTARNSYIPVEGTVKKVRQLSPSVIAITLELENKKAFSFKPGQFLMISTLGYGESVLTITSAACDLPEIEIAVRSVGNNTKALHRLKIGDPIWVSGPFGNHFDFRKMAGKEVVIIAGGIGLAPLRSLARTIEQDPKIVGKTTVIVGAKTAQDFIFKNDLKKWNGFADVYLTVDDADADWTGYVGQVPMVLDKIEVDKEATAIVCGPPVMFEPTIKKLEKAGVKPDRIFIMLERRMKCGMGKCQHCTCGDKYVCLDGPTFSWDELKDNWEVFK